MQDLQNPELDDLTPDELEQYLDEHRKMLNSMASFAQQHPDFVGQLRDALKFSASMLVTNRPGFKKEFQEVVDEIDPLLEAIEKGEVAPENFITEPEDKNKD